MNGIPADQSVFAVRVDPRDPRVLFAGTRSTVYVSLNGGYTWENLTLNLPVTEVRDIQIDAREGEVAVATHGRGFWILDHLAQVEDLARESGAMRTSGAQLFAPETAWITHAYGAAGFLPDAGDNPDYGATVFFNLPKNYDGRTPATLRFLDADGKVVRSFSLHLKNKKAKKYTGDELVAMDSISVADYHLQRLTAVEPGMNSFDWNMTYTPPAEIVGHHTIPTDDFRNDLSGATVLPGDYTVELTYGGTTLKTPLKIQLDPRFSPPAGALQARLTLASQIGGTLDALDSTVNAARAKSAHLSPAKRAQVDSIVNSVVELRFRSSEADVVYPSQLRDDLAFLMNSLDLSYQAPTPAQQDAYTTLKAQADEAIAKLKSIAGL
jgi:hypothetical protein